MFCFSDFLMPRYFRVLWTAVSVAVSVCAFAQSSGSPAGKIAPGERNSPTVSLKVRVVNLLATVRDKHGNLLPHLAVSDFTLEEDGKPVTIQYFSRDTDLPLTLGLLVDTSMSQRESLPQEKSASKTFFDKVLREEDKAFLIHFDREVELSEDLTSSRAKLESALASLEIASPYRQDDSGSGGPGTSGGDDPPRSGRGRGMHRAGTALYDAIFLAADELMKKQQGRKAVIVLSDGVDRGSKESLESAIEAAQRADTMVYAIYFKGEPAFGGRRGGFGYPGGGPMGGGGPRGGGRRGGGGRYPQEERPDGKKVLERISKETGGRMFEVAKKDSIDQIYGSIQEELRNQYNLGFTPARDDAAGYHKLLLKTSRKDDTVQTRAGFYLNRD
ncbi:MAG: VWA domain-containing protein [Acidobacteria bacterium]|nr:VWA domain-containing protein [Acidobacteriota bacterium]